MGVSVHGAVVRVPVGTGVGDDVAVKVAVSIGGAITMGGREMLKISATIKPITHRMATTVLAGITIESRIWTPGAYIVILSSVTIVIRVVSCRVEMPGLLTARLSLEAA